MGKREGPRPMAGIVREHRPSWVLAWSQVLAAWLMDRLAQITNAVTI